MVYPEKSGAPCVLEPITMVEDNVAEDSSTLSAGEANANVGMEVFDSNASNLIVQDVSLILPGEGNTSVGVVIDVGANVVEVGGFIASNLPVEDNVAQNSMLKLIHS